MSCLLSFECNFILLTCHIYQWQLKLRVLYVHQKWQSTALKVPLSSLYTSERKLANVKTTQEGVLSGVFLSTPTGDTELSKTFGHHLGDDCFPMLASLKHYLC